MDESLLFSSADLKVSNQHLNVRGKIYAIADINHVELNFIQPKRLLATILFLTGLFLLLDEGNLFALGGFSIILSVVFWVSEGTRYALVIHSAASEKQVYISSDRLLIEKVIYALDTAMLEKVSPKAVSSYSSIERTYPDSPNDINFGAS